MSEIRSLSALEILDSRGRPTIKAYLELVSGHRAEASVPSGASTGQAEAHELRDGDPKRYGGFGCKKAVQNIQAEIAKYLKARSFYSQKELDEQLIALDGTPNKSRLGANAMLAVSLAFARAVAKEQQIPLFQYFQTLLPQFSPQLPRLTINLFSGGKHAGGQVPIQDVLIVPLSGTSIQESLAQAWEVYQAGVRLVKEKYQGRWLTADEGGLAPPFVNLNTMFEDAIAAIELAGLKAGKDVALALDVAASHFYDNGMYHLGKRVMDGEEMVEELRNWVRSYPIISLEDGLSEEDWTHWSQLKQAIGNQSLVLGDDLLCTNSERIQKAIDLNAANALLLKVNQIGTLTQAATAFQVAKSADWQITVSARSGETEDNWLADLAVGWGGNQIKVGSITQSERLAKYNRLLEIEAETGWSVQDWQIGLAN